MKYLIYKNPVFRADIETEGGFTKVVASGILSSVLGQTASKEMSFFDNQKYIAALGGENAAPLNHFGGRQYENALIFSTWMPPIPSLAFKRMVRGRMGAAFGKYRPEQVTISITEECPNRCLHCALPNKNNHSKLTADAVKDAIDQAINAGATNIIFDGGEPLGYDGLEELISYVDPKKAIACMFTSGAGLTEEKAAALKKAGLYSISVSIDSPYEEKHDEMRGVSGIFKKAINGISNALKAGLLVNMYIVLAPHNADDLDAVKRLAIVAGVHELSFYEIVPTGRWLDRRDGVLTAEQHKKFEEFVENCNQDPTCPKIFSGPLVINEFGCMAGRQWLHITPEGNILPCSCVPIPYGNIQSGSGAVSEAWKKIRADPAYSKGKGCLMRDSEFREKYENSFQ
ncbi:MAG: radical SAM protein [Methanimicrococcus sp.]|nr:radical SAM protein [Methanimicrococcus sp.]